MVALICQVEMRIQDATTLKEKRSVVKSIIERTKKKYFISIIESDFQDFWQKCQLSFAFCSLNSKDTDKKLNNILNYIESKPYIEVYDIQREEVHL